MRFKLPASILAMLHLIFGGGYAVADVLQPPGSRVVIDAPEGFALGSGIASLEHPSGASFVVMDFPAVAYDEIRKGFTPEALTAAKMLDVAPLKLARTDEYLAYEGKATVGDIPFKRFLLVTHDAETTALVTANIPEAALADGSVKVEPVIKALSGVKFQTKVDEVEKFTLGYTGAFKKAGAMLGGTMTLYNLEGKMPEEKLTDEPAVLSVMVLPHPEAEIGDGRVLAETLLRDNKGRTAVTIDSAEPLTIGGLKGWEHLASGTSVPNNQPVGLYSALVLDAGGGFVLISGSVKADEFQTYLPEFRKIAQSFALKP